MRCQGQSVPTLHDGARDKLSQYAWPGNVRQLQNVMRRAFLMCRGKHILAAVEYDGWVSFEDFSTAQPLLERTRDNLVYAKGVLSGV